MKKIIIYSLAILGLISATIFLVSFKYKTPLVSYQYVFIIAEHHDLDVVQVSVDGKDFQKMKLTKQSAGDFDMGPLINLVHQYENDGYELQSFTGNGSFHYLWLRKEK